MLPGFRFLFAAILLSTSVLVFGLGAAALLRAAHEEIANIPARRSPPQPVLAQPNDTPPILAMVRLEPLAAENALDAANAAAAIEPIAELTAKSEIQVAAAPEDSAPAKIEDSAAMKVGDSEPIQMANAGPPVDETMPAASEAPAPPEAAAAEQAQPVVIAAAPASATAAASPTEAAPATGAAPAEPEQTAAIAQPESGVVATMIATPGGPAVGIGKPAPPKGDDANADQSAAKKRAKLQRARALRRARLAQQAQQAAPRQ